MKWNKEEEYQKKLGKRELSLLFFFWNATHCFFLLFCHMGEYSDISPQN